MLKIIVHGCGGAMGLKIAELVSQEKDVEIVAGIDIRGEGGQGFPVYQSVKDCQEAADAVIDFSVAQAVDDLLEWCGERGLPLVLCTTGLREEQVRKVERASERIPILRSANMSLGVNLLMRLVQEAAKVLAASGFDIEVVEKHHRRKKDAPSGTALSLADAVNSALDGAYHYTYDRSSRSQSRDPKEIGISSVRGGTIVGEHDVIFAGADEVVTLSHAAYSRGIFAKGSLSAAAFLAGAKPGLYSMSDVIGL